jgi:CubicO group peptidase (beta-lactamase class C family)
MKHIVSVFLFAGLFFNAKTQTPEQVKALDSLFNMLEQNGKMMGGISVFSNGHEIYHRLLGYRNITEIEKTKPDNTTQYRIGSLSKIFTAVLIMQLTEEGKLNLDAPLSTFYPQIYRSDSITIRQMLDHHSGLPPYSTTSQLDKLLKLKTSDAVIEHIAQEKGDWDDRKKGRYGNLNYILLGFIIEKITGSGFDQQLKERITDKLGLQHTYNLQEYIDPKKNQSHSFRYSRGAWREEYEEKWLFTDASGQMVSTVTELNIFINALFDGKLVSEKSLNEMKELRDRYGLGLHKAPYYKINGYGHTGRIDGFVSSLGYLPSEKLSVCLIINGQIWPMNDILLIAMDILHNNPYQIPSMQEVNIGDEVLQQYTGRYFSKEIHYKVKIKKSKTGNALQIQMKKKGGLLNAVLVFYPLSKTRFLNNEQGVIMDFDQEKKGFLMRISGSKVPFEKQD